MRSKVVGQGYALFAAAMLAGTIAVAQELPDTNAAEEIAPAPAKPDQLMTWAQAIMDAYPDEARKQDLSGKVTVAVAVTTEGRATDCEILTSSGYPILDEAACNGMIEYARFKPARDATGEPIVGRYSIKITYLAN